MESMCKWNYQLYIYWLTRLCSILYTGGCDTLVRIWKADSGADQEPETALDAEDPITALGVDVRAFHFYHTGNCLTLGMVNAE